MTDSPHDNPTDPFDDDHDHDAGDFGEPSNPAEHSIQVNFGRPMPLFPLDQVALLPQQVLPMHIFEPRYRQMVENVLDTNGQFALATFEGNDWKDQYHALPPIKPAVCIAHIVQHEKLPDGRYNIIVQGICRARILRELPVRDRREPDEPGYGEPGVLYREAILEPVGIEPPLNQDEHQDLAEIRSKLDDLLSSGPLVRMNIAGSLLDYVRNGEIPMTAVLELVAFSLVQPQTLRYRLLEEPAALERANLILHELDHLSRLITKAQTQHDAVAGAKLPKGCTWN